MLLVNAISNGLAFLLPCGPLVIGGDKLFEHQRPPALQPSRSQEDGCIGSCRKKRDQYDPQMIVQVSTCVEVKKQKASHSKGADAKDCLRSVHSLKQNTLEAINRM